MFIASAATTLAAIMQAQALPPQFHIVEIPLPGGFTTCEPWDVNDAGVVVGEIVHVSWGRQPFRWSRANGMQLLQMPFGSCGVAMDINEVGQIAGYIACGDSTRQAVRWEVSGARTDLLYPAASHQNPDSRGMGINDLGVVVGDAVIQDEGRMACLWSAGGTPSVLPDYDRWSMDFLANSIDNNGVVVGKGRVESTQYMVRWQGLAQPELLMTGEGIQVGASGSVIGTAGVAYPLKAFVWSPADSVQFIGPTPGDSNSTPNPYPGAINTHEVVVGFEPYFNRTRSWIWSAPEGRANLESRLDPASAGWKLYTARGINASGVITGRGVNPSGDGRAYVAIPFDHCPADTAGAEGNGVRDGNVDVSDLLYFLEQFQSGSAGADQDDGSQESVSDGNVDINDLLFFLTHFEAGC